jgi:hypothetical protein
MRRQALPLGFISLFLVTCNPMDRSKSEPVLSCLSSYLLTYLRSSDLFEKLPIVQPLKNYFLSLMSFIQGICPGPKLLINFRNKLIFYGKEILAPRPTPKLEDHPLSTVSDCLFNIFAATLHIWRPSPPSTTLGRAMPW